MSFKLLLNDKTQNYELNYKNKILFASNEKDFVVLYLVGHLMKQNEIKNSNDFTYQCDGAGNIEMITTSKNSFTAQAIEDMLFNKTLYTKIIGDNMYFVKRSSEIIGIDKDTFEFSTSCDYPVFGQKIGIEGAIPELLNTFGSYKNLERYFNEFCEQHHTTMKVLTRENLQKDFFIALEKLKLNIDENMSEFESISTEVLNLFNTNNPTELFLARNIVEFIRIEESKHALNLTNSLSDKIFSVESAYQSFFDLEQDDWHQHTELEQKFSSKLTVHDFIKDNQENVAQSLNY